MTIDTPSAKVLWARLQDVRRLERAIFRSQSTHGVAAPSNHRERNYALLREALQRYKTQYQRVFDEETLARVRLYPLDKPTATKRQFRSAAGMVGRVCRMYAEVWMDKAGFEPPEKLGVETAWTRQRADERFKKRRTPVTPES